MVQRLRRLWIGSIALALSLQMTVSWGATCRNNIVPKQSGAPLPTGPGSGSVVYEAQPTPTNPPVYDIYIFDLQSKKQLDLTKRWPFFVTSLNPHVSPSANDIVFTAQTYATKPAPGCNYVGVTDGRTDIFLVRMGVVPQLLNLTCGLSNLRYQDAIFTPNGKGLYAKVGGNTTPIQFQIVQYMLVDDDSKHPSLRTVATFLNSSQEVSAPYPSAYSRLLFYFSGTGDSEVAYSLNMQTMQSTAMTPTSACYSYFPIAGLSGQSVFVTAGLYESRVCSSNDQIFLGTPGGGFTQLPFNGCLINNSDPAPLDSSHTLFSSTLTGDYRAYLGNNSSGGTVWALTPIGLGAGTTDLRGMSYTTERLWVPAAN